MQQRISNVYGDMQRKAGLTAAICGLVLFGATAAMAQYPNEAPQPGSSFTSTYQIPPGTQVKVVVLDPFSSQTNLVGDQVRMRVAPDDTSGVPKSVVFVGHIRHVDPANNKLGGDVSVRFDYIETVGQWQSLTPPQSQGPAIASARYVAPDGAAGGKDDVAVGAGVGAVIGGARKGRFGEAVEGGLLGALGGLLVQKATTHPGYDINFNHGDETTVILRQPITLKTELMAS